VSVGSWREVREDDQNRKTLERGRSHSDAVGSGEQTFSKHTQAPCVGTR
jgi:hypothetical protein